MTLNKICQDIPKAELKKKSSSYRYVVPSQTKSHVSQDLSVTFSDFSLLCVDHSQQLYQFTAICILMGKEQELNVLFSPPPHSMLSYYELNALMHLLVWQISLNMNSGFKCFQEGRIIQLQNHRCAWVGTDLKAQLFPTPLTMDWNTFHYTRLLRAWSNLALNISKDGASTNSLGNLLHYLTTFTVKNFFLRSDLNLLSVWSHSPSFCHCMP